MATALRRLVRSEDGLVRVVYVDLGTFQPIPPGQLGEYQILEPTTIENAPLNSLPKQASPVSDQPIPEEVEDSDTLNQYLESGGALDASDKATGMSGARRDSVNDFGYRDKPRGMGLASALPGPLGMAGKAVNAAWNTNNLTASNAAREHLGLPERGTFGNIKGIVSDVGNVVSKSANIGGNDYQIGFGGVSEDGKTQLTPNEARTRSLVLDAPIDEANFSERGNSLRASPKEVNAPDVPSVDLSNTPSAPRGSQPQQTRAGQSLATTQNTNSVRADPAFGKEATLGMGNNRPAAPDRNFTQRVSNNVQATLGPGYGIEVTSGTYDDETISDINQAREEAARDAKAKGLSPKATAKAVEAAGTKAGQYGSTRHTSKVAGDVHITKDGQVVTDKSIIDQAAIGMGEAGLSVGRSPSYMGGTAIHVDDVRPDAPNTWGGKGKAANMDPDVRDKIQAGQVEASRQHNTLAGYKGGIATPSSNPRSGPPMGLSTAPQIDPLEEDTPVAEASAPTGYGALGYSTASAQATPANRSSIPAGPMSPASFTAAGLGAQYSPEAKTSMASTLSGELGPQSLAGLRAGSPEAIAEAATIAGTMDNRAMSATKQRALDPVAATLDPSVGNYDANLASKQANTRANFAAYEPETRSVIDDYLSGKTPSKAPNATSYQNKSVPGIDTSWSNAANQKIGPHSFGAPFNPGLSTISKQAFGYQTGPAASVGIGPSLATANVAGPSQSGMLSGKLGLGGGFVSDVGVSGVTGSSGLSGVSASDKSRASGQGMTGSKEKSQGPDDRGSMGSTGSDRGTSSLSGEARGGSSLGGSSLGGSSRSGGLGSSSSSGSKSTSSSGNPSAGAYGGGYGSPGKTSGSVSSKSSGSASSSKDDKRGGMSTGSGMGGFN